MKRWDSVAIEGATGAYRIAASEIESVHLDGHLSVKLESEWSVPLHVH